MFGNGFSLEMIDESAAPGSRTYLIRVHNMDHEMEDQQIEKSPQVKVAANDGGPVNDVVMEQQIVS